MKKLLFLFVFATISMTAFAQQDRVKGFRDIDWGTHKDSVFVDGEQVKFKKVKDALLPEAYVRTGDRMVIGSVNLSSLYYFFNEDNRLYKVQLGGGREQLDEMIFILDYKFGKFASKSTVDDVIYYQWVVQDVTFTLAEFSVKNFVLSIESDYETRAIVEKNSTVDDF